jgi:hypothetical protein
LPLCGLPQIASIFIFYPHSYNVIKERNLKNHRILSGFSEKRTLRIVSKASEISSLSLKSFEILRKIHPLQGMDSLVDIYGILNPEVSWREILASSFAASFKKTARLSLVSLGCGMRVLTRMMYRASEKSEKAAQVHAFFDT